MKLFQNDETMFIGKVPQNLRTYLKSIYHLYFNETPSYEINQTLNHVWYTESSHKLKSYIEMFQNHSFFSDLCENGIVNNIQEMDEIMYSNSKKIKNTNMINYYGATSNYKPHRDCGFCKYIFFNTNMYRVLISLNSGNKFVFTSFPEYNVQKNMNIGDMIGFDYDETLHQVINVNNKQIEPRLILKLHFLVCENCKLSSFHLELIKQFYIYYDRILRYYTKIGTDPSQYHEFVIGLVCHYLYVPHIEKMLFVYFMGSSYIIIKTKNYTINCINITKTLGISLLFLVCLHSFVSFVYYISFILDQNSF